MANREPPPVQGIPITGINGMSEPRFAQWLERLAQDFAALEARVAAAEATLADHEARITALEP